MFKRIVLAVSTILVLCTSAQEWPIGAATRLTENFFGSGAWHVSFTNVTISQPETSAVPEGVGNFERDFTTNLVSVDREVLPNVVVGVGFLVDDLSARYQRQGFPLAFDQSGKDLLLSAAWKLGEQTSIFGVYGYQTIEIVEGVNFENATVSYDATGPVFAFGGSYLALERSPFNLVLMFDRVTQRQEHKDVTFQNIPDFLRPFAEQYAAGTRQVQPEQFSTRLGAEAEYVLTSGAQGIGFSGFGSTYFVKDTTKTGSAADQSAEDTGIQFELGIRVKSSRFWAEAGYNVSNHGDAFKDGQRNIVVSISASF